MLARLTNTLCVGTNTQSRNEFFKKSKWEYIFVVIRFKVPVHVFYSHFLTRIL